MRNQAGGTSSTQYKVHKRKPCPCPSGTWNKASSLSSFVMYDESSRRDFIRLVRSRVKGGLDLARTVRGIRHVGLRSSSTKSLERRTYPDPSDMRNQSSRNLSVRYEVARKVSLSSSKWYDESSRLDFVRLVRSRVKQMLVLVRTKESSTRDFVRPV